MRPPLADVSETDDAYQVHIELHGIGRDWIDVQLVDGELIVTGEIIEEENGGRRRRSSRRTGRFEYRTFLPGDIKPAQVSADLADGMLTVTVPKSLAHRRGLFPRPPPRRRRLVQTTRAGGGPECPIRSAAGKS